MDLRPLKRIEMTVFQTSLLKRTAVKVFCPPEAGPVGALGLSCSVLGYLPLQRYTPTHRMEARGTAMKSLSAKANSLEALLGHSLCRGACMAAVLVVMKSSLPGRGTWLHQVRVCVLLLETFPQRGARIRPSRVIHLARGTWS